MGETTVERAGVVLAAEEAGEGTPVVLLHGLTATRRYVVMGSRALERSGHRVIAYDARAHGASTGAADGDYGYPALADDLGAVLDAHGIGRALLAGASMGAHTALAFALAHPRRVAALAILTPAYDPDGFGAPESLAHWDALAEGLRGGGVEGFVAAYGDGGVPASLRETVLKVVRQRLARHDHPEAVAAALSAVPRSRPFGALEELTAIVAPTVIVASHDDFDPGHPFAVAQAYATRIPGARLVTEEPGRSPLAWQGSQVSKVIAQLAAAAA